MNSERRSNAPMRTLSAEDLELGKFLATKLPTQEIEEAILPELDEEDRIFVATREALSDGFAGVIFSGPPGTSKTEYASRIANSLTKGDQQRARFIQFHPSFQYEDFVEGFVPKQGGGYELVPKHLRKICTDASKDPLNTYVLVIDEISRCDAARVFGEALTYLESSKRNSSFSLASGTTMSIPQNLVILATMNPWDRGVDEVDIALERRFAHIEMPPDSAILRELLSPGDFSDTDIDAIVHFFEAIQKLPNRFVHIGHAYFARARDQESVKRLWDLQLRHHFERACRSNTADFAHISRLWETLIIRAFAADNPDQKGESPVQAEASE
jgi:5-methylcytosine-specific restriction enzyme B